MPRPASAERPARGRESRFTWIGGAVLLAATTYATRGYVMDDALITLRYSYHLVIDGSAFWNPAQRGDPVQGYTTLLWMVWCALPGVFTNARDVFVLFAKASALGAALVTLGVFTSRLRSLDVSARGAGLILTLLFLQPAFGFHVNSAMETWAFASLLILAVHLHVSEASWTRKYGAAALASLTRPEGALAMGVLGLHDFVRGRWRDGLGGLALGVCSAGVSLSVSKGVYDSWLPNSFYRKQATGLEPEALRYSLFFLLTLGAVPLGLACYSALRLRPSDRPAVLIALAYLAYFLSVKPWMNVFSRFQWAAYLLLLYAALPALAELYQRRREWPMAWSAAVLGFVVLAAGNLVGVDYQAKAVGQAMSNSIRLGKALAEHRQPDRWLMYHDAGAICFFSDWNCYETIGLNMSERQLEEWPVDRALADPRMILHLQNLPGASDQAVELDRRMDALGPFGFELSQAVPTLLQGDQRSWYITAHTKPALAPALHEELRTLELPAEIAPLWSWELYRRARELLKHAR